MTCMMRYDQAYVVITRTSEIPSSRLKNAPCDKIWRTRFLESRCSTWLALQERKLSINTLQTSCFLNNKRSFRRVIENVMQYMLQKLCDNICATVTNFFDCVVYTRFFLLQVPLTHLKIATFIITRLKACRSHANVGLEVASSKPFTWKWGIGIVGTCCKTCPKQSPSSLSGRNNQFSPKNSAAWISK